MAKTKYQYGTSPRKLEPEYNKYRKKNLEVRKTQEKEQVKVSKSEKAKITKRISIVLILFAILFTISYRNSQINESFNQVQNLKKQLALVEKENEQLKVNIENSLNTNNIEQAAMEKLGMQKLTNKQIIYVSLPKKDYIESPSEEVKIEQEYNFIEKIIRFITKK